MEDEVECWSCHEMFEPDGVYEFPGVYVYWHKCTDGILTQVTVENKKLWRRFVPDWVRKPTAKDRFNKTLKLIYAVDKKIIEDEYDE